VGIAPPLWLLNFSKVVGFTAIFIGLTLLVLTLTAYFELLREYLGTMKVGDAAKRLRVARSTLSRLLNGRASFTAQMALRLADALGTSRSLASTCRQQYDLWRASRRQCDLTKSGGSCFSTFHSETPRAEP
jgi:antitoxin HigA-1